MAALISFFVILIISLSIVRIAAVLLKLTGLSEESAKFQARSAFTGTGFTTRESENVVNHPVRRKIVMVLMLMRNVGFISVISSLVISFIGTNSSREFLLRLAYLVGGLILLVLIGRSKLLYRIFGKLIERALKRWTSLRVGDYESLLNLSGEYAVSEATVKPDVWIADRSIMELRLNDEGVLILGIQKRDGAYVGTPRGESRIEEGDRVVLYGREEAVRAISERPAGPAGDKEHEEAVSRMKRRGVDKAETETKKKRGFIGRLFGGRRKQA